MDAPIKSVPVDTGPVTATPTITLDVTAEAAEEHVDDRVFYEWNGRIDRPDDEPEWRRARTVRIRSEDYLAYMLPEGRVRISVRTLGEDGTVEMVDTNTEKRPEGVYRKRISLEVDGDPSEEYVAAHVLYSWDGVVTRTIGGDGGETTVDFSGEEDFVYSVPEGRVLITFETIDDNDGAAEAPYRRVGF